MLHDEGQRILTICNACRYCEGFCAVFPAMEKRQEFLRADLNYLANLCHNCQECFYACQYAPPHEFAVNVPKTLAQIRIASYQEYASPAWFRRTASLIAWIIVFASAAASLRLPYTRGSFYDVMPHGAMVGVFGSIALFVCISLSVSMRRFWGDIGMQGPPGSVLRALRNVLQLEYLRSGGAGCTYPQEDHSQARRRFHHLTFYGFLLCFASTAVAAVYHYAFNWKASYDYLSVPVVLGTLGGAGLLIGPLGLGWLRSRQNPATANGGQQRLDAEFIALLFLTSLTGLLLLVFRESRFLPTLLLVHLGFVAALFVTMPYGKFVHGLYRSLALLRYAREQD